MRNMVQIERIEIPLPFPPGSSNCYFIPDSKPALIDTGVNAPGALQSLHNGLAKFGADIRDIRRIILTHGHSDHAGLAGAAAAASRAPVFVHCMEKARMLSWSGEVGRENEELFRRFFKEAGVPEQVARERTEAILDRFRKYLAPISEMEMLKGGEVFSFDLFKLKVLHTPGHTAGSICLFDDSEGLLFSGDCLIKNVVPYISAELRDPEGLPRYYALERYEKSLELLAALPVSSVLPGHGAPFSGHRKLIERVKHNRAQRWRRTLEILKAQKGREAGKPGMSQFEVLKRMFLGASAGGALFMGISEVRGCLEVMEKQGLVAAVINDGKRLYSLNSGHHADE